MSGKRQAFATRREAMGFTQESFAAAVGVEFSTVGRWERGVLTPQPWRRSRIAQVLGVSLDELNVLLGQSRLSSQSSSHRCQGGVAGVDPGNPALMPTRREAVRGAALLTGTVLADRWLASSNDGAPVRSSDGYCLPDLDSATVAVSKLHETYQAARYAELVNALPIVSEALTALASTGRHGERRQALVLLSSSAVVEAKLATKLGDGAAARVAAERAKAAADEADDLFGQAAAAYQMTCALLKLGQPSLAEDLAVSAAEAVTGDDPRRISWAGALTLIAAIIAARRNEPNLACDRLDAAQRLAERLGGDANFGYTAFGLTNVAIHRMAAAVSLDDPYQLLATSERLTPSRMPAGLRGRRAQFHLDSAWGHMQIDEDALAVLHLLETDRIAPEFVCASGKARALIRDLMARERRREMPGLRELAMRVGVTS
ncbi:helix-turn-helix domain-containing protein [Actinokineospora sp. NPDC004072]